MRRLHSRGDASAVVTLTANAGTLHAQLDAPCLNVEDVLDGSHLEDAAYSVAREYGWERVFASVPWASDDEAPARWVLRRSDGAVPAERDLRVLARAIARCLGVPARYSYCERLMLTEDEFYPSADHASA
ncbi:MAG: hypothetical protein ACLGHM_09065 [Actinomycetes bacterium]